jgi:outer membrane protein assembly factor BamA
MNETKVRRSFLEAACFTLALAPGILLGQSIETMSDPLIRTVRVKSQGDSVSEQYVLGYVSLRAGQPFNKDAAANTVRALYSTGKFDQVSVVPELDAAKGQIDLVVVVEPRPTIAKFEYIGGDGLFDKESDDRYADGLRIGEPLDKAALRRVEVKLQKEIRKKRPFTTVDAQIYKVPGGVCVSYVVRESADLRVDNITIEGAKQLSQNEIIEGAELKASNWRWWKFSWLLSNGRLDPEDYKKDILRLPIFTVHVVFSM